MPRPLKPRLWSGTRQAGARRVPSAVSPRLRDGTFEAVGDALAAVEEVAWGNYPTATRCSRPRLAGPDPDATRCRPNGRTRGPPAGRRGPAEEGRRHPLAGAADLRRRPQRRQLRQRDLKTFRMTLWAREVLEACGIEVDLLDLSLLTSSYDLHIHPCKVCVSTAMPCATGRAAAIPNSRHAPDQRLDGGDLRAVDGGSTRSSSSRRSIGTRPPAC